MHTPGRENLWDIQQRSSKLCAPSLQVWWNWWTRESKTQKKLRTYLVEVICCKCSRAKPCVERRTIGKNWRLTNSPCFFPSAWLRNDCGGLCCHCKALAGRPAADVVMLWFQAWNRFWFRILRIPRKLWFQFQFWFQQVLKLIPNWSLFQSWNRLQ